MGKIIAFCKINCPYSIMTAETLETVKETEINWIDTYNLDKENFLND